MRQKVCLVLIMFTLPVLIKGLFLPMSYYTITLSLDNLQLRVEVARGKMANSTTQRSPRLDILEGRCLLL